MLDAYGSEPFVSCFLADSAQGVVADGAVVWRRDFHGRRVLMADGPAEAAAGLLTAMARVWRPDRITVPQQTFERLPVALRPEVGGRWHWFHTFTAPEPTSAEAGVGWLAESDFAAIGRLLDAAFPDASSRPDPLAADRRWFGARDADGAITACGTVSAGEGAGPMLGSIAVHPDARRRGLGSAVTAWVTRTLLAQGHPMVALGSYAGEDATHRIYRRLGYRDTRVLVSARLTAIAT